MEIVNTVKKTKQKWVGVGAWATRSLSIAVSQTPKILVEKGNLEQDLAGEKAMQR